MHELALGQCLAHTNCSIYAEYYFRMAGKLSENGSVYIAPNGNKYKVLGVNMDSVFLLLKEEDIDDDEIAMVCLYMILKNKKKDE